MASLFSELKEGLEEIDGYLDDAIWTLGLEQEDLRKLSDFNDREELQNVVYSLGSIIDDLRLARKRIID